MILIKRDYSLFYLITMFPKSSSFILLYKHITI